MTPEERMNAAREALAGCSGWPEGRCETGKRMYKDRKSALAEKRHKELKISMSRKNIRFDAYRCKECNWWHLATRGDS